MSARNRSWFTRLWQAERSPILFMVVTWAFAISVNFWSEWFGTLGSSQWRWWPGWVRGPFMLVSPALFGVALYAVWPRRHLEAPASHVRPAGKCRGVVVIQSRKSEAAWEGVAHHFGVCERVWIIHSKMSEDDANQLRARLVQEGRLPEGSIMLIALDNSAFENPEQVRDRIESDVFDQLPDDFAEDDVAIDITGGGKRATAGAFLAGLPPGRRLQVLEAVKDPETGRALATAGVSEIRLDYDLKRHRAG